MSDAPPHPAERSNTPASSSRGRVPPHNLDAEESVLGAMLLSQEAIGSVAELGLNTSDFYKPAHRHIYDAIRALYTKGSPADVITVADELRRHDLLDEVGGLPTLHQLQNDTPAISSAKHYGSIVQNTALLRQLIFAASDISELAYSEPDDVPKTLDEAESRIFRVAEDQHTDSTRGIRDLFPDVMTHIEEAYERGNTITGVPTGYTDLDELLSGLQESALYIVGARPAMGKCVAHDTPIVDPSTGEVVTAAELMERAEEADAMSAISIGADGHQTVTAMSHCLADGIKPVFTVRTRSGREVTITATHPLLTAKGWRPLEQIEVGEPIAVPRHLPVFGTDQLPNADIDLLARTVDQRIPASIFRLPRVQLARFLKVFFVHIGNRTMPRQLARDVQHLLLRFGIHAKLSERSGAFAVQVLDAGTGWSADTVPVEVWDDIIKAKGGLTWREINRRCGRTPGHNWHPFRGRVRRETVAELAEALDDEQLRWWASPDVMWDDIVAIDAAGDTQVIDFTVPGLHNFVAADMYLHNTAFGLGIATNVVQATNKPVLVFSLEMGHLELTQRILASEARVDSTKLRTGQLTENDWSKIGSAIARLELPLFLDDNPRVTVNEIRAKARRLNAQYGGLGAIVIDYLQLMGGNSSAENRQLEVSDISRNLKVLARELKVPIVALSQLSRNLEARADKRPMLADLRESGCLTASTRLLRADNGAEVTLGELLEMRDVPVWSLDEHYRLVPSTLTHAFPSGRKPVFRTRLASGRVVEATANHKFRTIDGWTPLGDLDVGSRVAVPRRVDTPLGAKPLDPDEIVLLAHLLGDGCVLPRQPVHYTSADPANLDAVERAAVELFGITARRVAQGNWWHSYLPSPHHLTHGRRNPVAEWWDGFGLHDCRSGDKFVPDAVFGLPSAQVALFLRHLWATDGSLSLSRSGSPVNLYFGTSSRRFADDVRQLLLRLDIRSRLTIVEEYTGRSGYQLRIDGAEQQRRFLSEVGVHGERGRVIPEALRRLDGVRSNPNVDTIPYEAKSLITSAMAEAGMTHRQLAEAIDEQYCGSYLLGYDRRPRSSNRERVARIADAVGSKELDELANSDVEWDRIVEIEPIGERDVYDATVLGTHNFIGNGVVLHNSLEQDADVVMFLYRDEVYHAESPDKGSAEVIVAKHRAGPTGIKRLVFLGQYTRFENAAKSV